MFGHGKPLPWAAYWGIPPLFALVLYWHALHAWFQADDFVWLNLLPQVHKWSDVWYALFHPTVHGTWRPLGERAYFLSLQALFGYDSALPFRIVAFLVQFASMALISAITFQLTRSRIAGFLAPVVWISSDKVVLLMAWNSNINYVFCGFFILSALWLFLRHIETDRARYLVATWAAFILGLGTLETAIVFPVMAMIYAWAYARAYFKKTLFVCVVGAVFAMMHNMLVPKQAGGPYGMHFDSGILGTLVTYWRLALQPVNLSIFTRLPESASAAAMILSTIALAGHVVLQAARRNWIPLVFLSWFVILLLPVLPLRDHITDYYLSLPLIALAMLAVDGFAHAWRGGLAWRGAALALLAFFLFESGLVAHRAAWWSAHRSWNIRSMFMGVKEAHRARPEQAILLENMDDSLFWAAFQEGCFQLLGMKNVYLTPGSDSRISAHPEIDQVARFIMPAATVREALSRGQLSVYAWNGNQLHDITGQYFPGASPSASPAAAATPPTDRIDVADPKMANRLDASWYPIDQGFRWMPRRAFVRMKNPALDGQHLRISGYCPAALLQKGAVHLTVSVNAVPFPPVRIEKGDAAFEFQFRLQPGLPKEIEVALEVDRTFGTPADGRELGLVFGVFEIRAR